MLNETVPPDQLGAELSLLHNAYVWQLNAAVADREDVAPELADLYVEEALSLLTDLDPEQQGYQA